MGFVAYLIGISIAALLCWTAFSMAVFSVNPFKADFISIASFFVSLFFALTATITAIIFMRFIWFNSRFHYLKTLSFSIIASIVYTFVHIIFNIILKTPISGNLFFSYFRNGFLLMITMSVSMTLSEILFRGITDYFKPIVIAEDSDDE